MLYQRVLRDSFNSRRENKLVTGSLWLICKSMNPCTQSIIVSQRCTEPWATITSILLFSLFTIAFDISSENKFTFYEEKLSTSGYVKNLNYR